MLIVVVVVGLVEVAVLIVEAAVELPRLPQRIQQQQELLCW